MINVHVFPSSIPLPALLHRKSAGGHRSSCRAPQPYIRRRPEQTVLHQAVHEHLETFLAETRRRGGGEGLPRFVERERREFLTCGVMGRDFARFRCSGCEREILVAFSCKGRGFCPSCCGRRMCALAAHLHNGRRCGVEVKFNEARKVTKSLRIALADLRLAHLWVVYPGEHAYPAEERITMLPLREVAQLPEHLP